MGSIPTVSTNIMQAKYIRVASDLHLEAFPSRDMSTLVVDFLPEDERDKESILVLAGDICTGLDRLIEFLHCVEHRFKHVHYIPGNHEYYRENMNWYDRVAPQRANTHLQKTQFNAGKVNLAKYFKDDGSDHVRIITGTLWGDGGKSLFERAMVGRYLNDFKLIYLNTNANVVGFNPERSFLVSDMMAINKAHREEIELILEQEWRGKTVIATHHMPSYLLCHPRFGTEANGGFASDCESLIFTYKPDVWIHGHTHDTIDEMMGNTRIVCNPAGYRGEWQTEFNTFQPKFIEL